MNFAFATNVKLIWKGAPGKASTKCSNLQKREGQKHAVAEQNAIFIDNSSFKISSKRMRKYRVAKKMPPGGQIPKNGD